MSKRSQLSVVDHHSISRLHAKGMIPTVISHTIKQSMLIIARLTKSTFIRYSTLTRLTSRAHSVRIISWDRQYVCVSLLMPRVSVPCKSLCFKALRRHQLDKPENIRYVHNPHVTITFEMFLRWKNVMGSATWAMNSGLVQNIFLRWETAQPQRYLWLRIHFAGSQTWTCFLVQKI